MSYRNITSDILVRFTETDTLLRIIKSNESRIVPPALIPIEHKILKGLFYTSLYACIEFAFNELCTKTLILIKNKNIHYSHFESKFLTIALSSSLQTIRDCNSKKFLDKASDIFYLAESSEIANFNETIISQYLQNIWGKSFNQLTKTFGISSFPISPREIAIFDEIVENRNIVAHGRDLAQNIGSSPQYSDLKSKFDLVFETINRYISHFEVYYNSNEFIKISSRGIY